MDNPPQINDKEIGVNFINVKHARFSYERQSGSFFSLNVRSKSCQNVHSYKKFVKQNEKLDIKLNIIYLYLSGKEIFPLECGIGEGSKTVNLLLLMIPIEDDDGDGVNVNHHFVLIKKYRQIFI